MKGIAVVVAAALLSGCGFHMAIRPEAFDKGQGAALLLLHAGAKVYAEPLNAGGPGTGMPLRGPGAGLDAAPVLAAVRPVIVEALSRNPHFLLVPEARALSARGYVAYQGSEPPLGAYIVPKGYKWITAESAFPPIARELGADMTMGIMLHFFYRRTDGAAIVDFSLGILGADGRGIWKHHVRVYDDRPVNVLAASEPERIEAFKVVTRKAMALVEREMTVQLTEARGRLHASR